MEFKLSLYEELKSIHKSRKVEIFIVQNIQDEKIYIKKVIKEYTKEIYEVIKNINCKNIPKIYEILEKENQLIIIEEFINGNTLQEIVEKEKKLREKEVIEYMISLCDALYEIHSLNPPIIHRDIKPANIIISNDNILKLIDFDISRIYKEGESLDTTLLGTKGYASPEQFGFDQTDCRSDIYAMGIMMNVLTTGKHIKEEFNNTLLKDIIKKCTNISAEKRYANVLDLKEELKSKLYDKKYTKMNKKAEHYYSKALPGFRTKNPIYMIGASLWYLFLIMGLFVAKGFNEFLGNIILVIVMLSTYFIFTNYLGIKNKLPLIKSEKVAIRLVGYFIYVTSIFLIGGGLLSLTMN
ncbi:serine/threonine-protein kinase [Terrisporobacter petrolearius]|uniref:serine/threonine-protein kinase n=1 Tax=Terrisporobacter petrolearius TaxID=1460447 RepID=UPI0031CCAC1E